MKKLIFLSVLFFSITLRASIFGEENVTLVQILVQMTETKNLLEDVQPAVRDSMTFHLVDSIPEVLSVAFEETPWRPILRLESVV